MSYVVGQQLLSSCVRLEILRVETIRVAAMKLYSVCSSNCLILYKNRHNNKKLISTCFVHNYETKNVASWKSFSVLIT